MIHNPSALMANTTMSAISPQQQQVIDALIRGENVFMTGPGGTGKSHVIKTLQETVGKPMADVKGRPFRIAITALTGCAALLLNDGKTLHSWAGIGLGKDPVGDLLFRIRRNGRAKKNWVAYDLLVIDEISMATSGLLETLDAVAKAMRRSNKPFGGLQLLFSGDFYQLPPVTKTGATVFAFESPLWPVLVSTSILLTDIHRQSDPVFQRILNEARMGSLTAESMGVLESRRIKGTALKDQMDASTVKPTLIFSRNNKVDDINNKNMEALDTPLIARKSKVCYGTKTDPSSVNMDDPAIKYALNRLENDAPYVPMLSMKVGAQVMLITNLDVEGGLVNGSRGVIKRFTETELPIVEFRNGIVMTIDLATWMTEEFPFVGMAQIPLRIAYAITIHKSQGATLDCALVDVGKDTFEYGQAYVALSRVRSLDGLYIWGLDITRIKAHPRVVQFYQSLENV